MVGQEKKNLKKNLVFFFMNFSKFKIKYVNNLYNQINLDRVRLKLGKILNFKYIKEIIF